MTAAADGRRPSATAIAVLLSGAFVFAGCNVLAKVLYLAGTSQAALFIIRGAAVFLLNGALDAVRNGRASAKDCLTLRVDSAALARLALCRSVAGFFGITLLNIAFMYMHLADVFAITLAVLTLGTTALAVGCLGERLSASTLGGGAIALVGIVLVTQPSALFAGVPPSATGVAISFCSGVCFSFFGALTRLLGRGAPGTRPLSPAMLLSYYMVVVGLGSAAAAVAASAVGPAAAPAWAAFHPPARDDALSWALTLLYCLGILVGQLCLAAGYAMLPAAHASVLSLTELSFSWSLGTFALGEPTNGLACAGTLTIFAGCALAAAGKAPKSAPAGAAAGGAGGGGSSSRNGGGGGGGSEGGGSEGGGGDGDACSKGKRAGDKPFWKLRRTPAPLAASDAASEINESDWVECAPAAAHAAAAPPTRCAPA